MALIDDVKNKCYITAADDLTTNRIERILADAKIKIARLIGVSDGFTFENAGEERELLLNYVWYAWNDAENEFKNNYIDDIQALRFKHEVEQYKAADEVASND